MVEAGEEKTAAALAKLLRFLLAAGDLVKPDGHAEVLGQVGLEGLARVLGGLALREGDHLGRAQGVAEAQDQAGVSVRQTAGRSQTFDKGGVVSLAGGATLFLMLWEARGRYLFGFVAVLLLLAAHGALRTEEGM